MRHTTIALFVPHRGCPHQCAFCNQHSISGVQQSVTADDVHQAVAIAKKNPALRHAEIAFFGGSFTAIDRSEMLALLAAAQSHLDGEIISGIRISTRPDAVDDEICTLLRQFGVTAVELGAQSMDDTVLAKNSRGHTAQDVITATKRLQAFGFETGLQMMTGLYGADADESVRTAAALIALHPDTVRIYPTVVLEHTRLAELYREGVYQPQTVEEAADCCADLLLMFMAAGIRVIRVGLHASETVAQTCVAGAYHPAFRELCDSRIYRKAIQKQLGGKGAYTVFVPRGALSQAIGQKKANAAFLRSLGYDCRFRESETLLKYQVLVKENEHDSQSA